MQNERMRLFEIFLKNKNGGQSQWILKNSSESLTRSDIIFLVEKKFKKLFQEHKIKNGDIIFIENPQNPQFLPFLMSALTYGLVVLPLYERTSEYEKKSIFNLLQPKAIFNFKTESIWVNPKAYDSLICEPGIIFQTSGTTGNPKLVFQNERNLIHNGEISILRQNISPNSLCYSVLTMSHSGGLNMQVLPTLMAGGQVFLDSFFSSNVFVENAQSLCATHYVLIPSHYRALKAKGIFSNLLNRKIQPVILTGSEPVASKFFDDVNDIRGLPLAVYGMTEVGPFICSNTQKQTLPPKAVSCLGRFEKGYGGRLNDRAVIEVCGPGLNDFVVCEDKKVFTKKMACQWFETGDFGLEVDGVFFFSGRGDHEVNMGGYKFSLYEVEWALSQLPFVKTFKVFKTKDILWNELPEADVELTQKGISSRSIRLELRKFLSPLKIPRKINIVESIKKTSINKVKR